MDVKRRTREILGLRWYRRLLLAGLLIALPFVTSVLSLAEQHLLASSAMLTALVGLLIGPLQVGLVLALFAGISVATTAGLRGQPPEDLMRRMRPALLAAAVQLGVLVAAAPVVVFLYMVPVSLWDLPALAVLVSAVVWSSLLVAAAGDLGFQDALHAIGQGAQGNFWRVTGYGAGIVLAGMVWLKLIWSLFGGVTPLSLWLMSAGAMGVTAAFALLWATVTAAVGTSSQRRLAPVIRLPGLPEAPDPVPDLLLRFLRGDERI